MSSYELWKILHICGVLLTFGAIGGLASLAIAQGPQAAMEGKKYRMLHGIALAIVIVGGFGTLAALGFHSPASWGAWVWIKLGVWLALGASLVVIKRSPGFARIAVVVCALLGALAVWAAITKPGV